MPDKILLPKGTVIPNHIAMILDGNRRWARSRGLKPWEGHTAGYKAVDLLSDAARNLGVHTFTVWAFSTENWERPKEEIDAIMNIFRQALKVKEKQFHQDRVALVHLGKKDRLPTDIAKNLARIEEETAKYSSHNIFNLAVDYGGRNEIVRAVKQIIKDGVNESDIDEKLMSNYLDTAGEPYPEPDLFIRTSGEQRTSGLLPWQMTYTEYYFAEEHLPDFTPNHLKAAILDFSRRRRRFGGNDTVEHFQFDPKILAKLELKWWRLGKIPEGVSFMEYAEKHAKEQYGLSKKLAKDAAIYMYEAVKYQEKKKWSKAKVSLKKLYKLIKDEVKLAFEPEIAASLEVQMRQGNGEDEGTAKEFLAEVYRISLFQAAKAAHLKVLANVERNKGNWDKAEDYLEKYYAALKERVA